MNATANGKSERGFTLVELLVYMGLLSIFIVVLTQIFVSSLDLQLETQSVSSIELDGNYSMTRLAYDIRRASSIVVPSSLGTADTLQLVINGINYTYTLNNGNVELNQNGSTDTLNGYDTTISNLSFTRIGNVGGRNSIQVRFTVQSKTITSVTREKVYSSTISLRQN